MKAGSYLETVVADLGSGENHNETVVTDLLA